MGLNEYWRKSPFSGGIAKSGASSQTGGDAPLLPEEEGVSGGSLFASSDGSIFGISRKKDVESTGSLAVVPTTGGSGSTYQECFDSSSCAIGWKCVGNVCVPPNGIAGSNSSESNDTGCGTAGGGDGGGGGGGSCSPAPSPPSAGGCTKTGCGDGGGDGGDGGGPNGGCCSPFRCCRFTGCSCGPCPPPTPCSDYCNEYESATGDPAPGCGPDKSCDECSFCNEDGECESRVDPNLPCYCDNGRDCSVCEDCNKDGSCTPAPNGCFQCCTVSLPCDCGIEIQKTCCFPVNLNSQTYEQTCIGKCLAGAQADCDSQCPPPDPGPEPCDCNCNDDCGDCEICNESGKCVPDPECQCTDIQTYTVTLTQDSYSIAQPNCSRPNGCGDIGFNPAASWTVGLNAKGPLSISYENTGPVYQEGNCGFTEYIPGSRAVYISDCEGNLKYQHVFAFALPACAGDTQITGSAVIS